MTDGWLSDGLETWWLVTLKTVYIAKDLRFGLSTSISSASFTSDQVTCEISGRSTSESGSGTPNVRMWSEQEEWIRCFFGSSKIYWKWPWFFNLIAWIQLILQLGWEGSEQSCSSDQISTARAKRKLSKNDHSIFETIPKDFNCTENS